MGLRLAEGGCALPTIEVRTTIERPVEEVWNFVSEIRNELRWVAGAERREWLSPGGVQKGTRLRRVDRCAGQRLDSRFEVTEHAPPTRFGSRTVTGDGRETRSLIRLERADDGTAVTMRIDIDGCDGLPGRVAESMVSRPMHRSVALSLARLKAVLESEVAEPAGEVLDPVVSTGVATTAGHDLALWWATTTDEALVPRDRDVRSAGFANAEVGSDEACVLAGSVTDQR